MRRSTFLLAALLALASTTQANPIQGKHLKIVTLPNKPFVIDEGNGQFDGFLIDLVKILSEKLGFTYTVSVPEDHKYGAINLESGKWSGLVGELVDGKADLAFSDLTITDKRQEVVDFTRPFMNLGISIIYKKSGELPFKNVEELFKLNGEIPYGAVSGGSTFQFFKESENPIYQGIYKWLSENPKYLANTYNDALKHISEGKYAFFMESPIIDYITGKDCDLVRVGGLLNEKGYGIAGQKNSPYIQPLNEALLELVDSGKIQELNKKWWKVGEACAAH